MPDLPEITVPALICGSFSDNNLHSRGSFRGLERIASADRFLYTHRGGKWATFYSDRGPRRPARVLRPLPARQGRARRCRGSGSRSGKAATSSASVRDETNWPLDGTEWRPLYLTGDGLDRHAARRGRPARLRHPARRRLLGWTRPRGHRDHRADGAAAVGRGARHRRHQPVRRRGEVARAELRAVRGVVRVWPGPDHHRLAEGRAARPRHAAIPAVRACAPPAPSASRWRPARSCRSTSHSGRRPPCSAPGEQLRLVVAGRWLWPRNPLTGQFPAAYKTSRPGTCTLHWGPGRPACLLLPVIPKT